MLYSNVTVTTLNDKEIREMDQIILTDNNQLRKQRVLTTFDIVREYRNNLFHKIVSRTEVNKEVKTIWSQPLIEVSAETLRKYRNRKIPYFVLKRDGKIYFTKISRNTNLISSDLLACGHKCRDCKKLSMASDENGGCLKVRNFSKCIETYTWISSGYETWGTKSDCFVVENCSHFRKHPKDQLEEESNLENDIDMAEFRELWESQSFFF